jgi:preprotein translocase subunit SecA
MIGNLVRGIFGSRNDRILSELKPLVSRVNELEPKMKDLTDSELAGKTFEFKERIEKGESLESLEAESYAVVREASRRVLGMRHFDVQLIGGAILHRGKIAEMKTGEGKTLVATLPAYLNSLTGQGVHIVTVNDYLAKRDAEWMGRVYRFLNLSVGVVVAGRQSDEEKHKAYASDIVYGQNNEFGFDYLRDNMKMSLDEKVQRGHAFAIVDEVDSILIDEARTPLIISGPAEEATDKYYAINKIIPYLEKDIHYEIEARTKQPTLTDAGIAKCEELLNIDNLYDPRHIELVHHIGQALRAHTTLERDKDYVVKDGKVIIVDEFTGRLMEGRRWSNGLHQAVEAKEGLKVTRENVTLASITFQNYFRLYKKLAGMTGTADTEAVEFQKIYGLEVVVVPTNKPLIRKDLSDEVYLTRKEKYNAVCEDILEIHKTGQPILVGTVSIEQSEQLSKLLSHHKVPHSVLNAKHHEREAEIVAQAGRFGAVTIATNMAGRGTDIILGGNPEFLAAAEVGTRDPENQKYKEALERFKRQCAAEREKVVAAGGLFIMGTERHESRRIDNQLRGRSGRQGDPGASRFYISLEDDLMTRFAGDFARRVMKMAWKEGEALDGRLITRSIETAQKRVEAYHFEARKHILDYDDVLNRQRKAVYEIRDRLLAETELLPEAEDALLDVIESMVLAACPAEIKPIGWNIDELKNEISNLIRVEVKIDSDSKLDQQGVFDQIKDKALLALRERFEYQQSKLNTLKVAAEGLGGEFDFNKVVKSSFLEHLDKMWNMHLQEMDDLRDGIGLRAYAQKNPLYEYQKEGFKMFEEMMFQFKQAALRDIFYMEFLDEKSFIAALEGEKRRREAQQKQMKTHHDSVLEEEKESREDIRAKMNAARKERRKNR